MGLILRQCYLLLPTFLASIAFVWLIIAFLDQITQSSSLVSSLYYLELKPVTPSWSSFSTATNTSFGLVQTYTVGLWNSCANYANGTAACSSPVPAFAFDYLAAVNLLGGAAAKIDAILPPSWSSASATYHAAMIWLFAAYCAALCLTAATILAGLLAYLHSSVSTYRTAFLAWLAALFAVAASATASALFLMIRKVVLKNLTVYGFTAILGTRLLAYSWAGSGFMLAAAISWLFRCSRCDGLRREFAAERERRRQRQRVSKYQRSSAQYVGQPYSQMREPDRGSAYEPLSGWQSGRSWSQAGPGAEDKLPMPQPMGAQPQWYGQQRGSVFDPMFTGRRVWVGGMGGMGGMGNMGNMGNMGAPGPYAMHPVTYWDHGIPPLYM